MNNSGITITLNDNINMYAKVSCFLLAKALRSISDKYLNVPVNAITAAV
jgi:hypothetical protein